VTCLFGCWSGISFGKLIITNILLSLTDNWASSYGWLR
jgi:hypothetical protein